MTSTETPAQGEVSSDRSPTDPAPARRPRVWLPALFVGLYWAYCVVSERMGMPTFTRFMSQMATLLAVTLGFFIWWLLSRGLRFSQRLIVLGVAIAGAIAAVLLAHRSLGPITIMKGLPWMLTAWALWLVAARWLSSRTRFAGAIVVLLLAWGVWPMLRMEGLTGTGDPALHWRWSTSSEEAYLAQRGAAPRRNSSAATQPDGVTGTLVASPGDWTGFRGPNRDGVVRGVRIATDWNTTPPKLLWRKRVGPAWSSVAVVGNRVFTQEQRGETEAVVCRDAGTGSEIWSHEDPIRFSEILSGPGPRATPTFAEGRLYTFSATGTLNCLDAATGQRKWSRDVAAEAGAKTPMWGFASSPLVTHRLVIVFAGGEGRKGLMAYLADSGDPAWSAAAGHDSYSSPQLATVGGEEQVLFLSERGLTAVDAATGSPRWEFANANAHGAPRSLQPLAVAPDQFLISLGMELETADVEVSRNSAGFTASQRWASRQLKPSFNDSVLCNGCVYGFDGPVFCCIDARTGERRWKHGRYGTGQVLLLADQPILLVLTDTGEVVLVAASPDGHQELGRFQAINGKTWNHPVIAHDRLYVRNAEEMACFELTPAQSR
ncbi:MAG TPA: PQQ-binding-like beta-propeller repeat protein [Gemmataceae bacterium]|nr:PQQ-binding-like beta-propeller repeat protein [Gemmataceae bacterium]